MDIQAERERLKSEIENLVAAINHRYGQLSMLEKLEKEQMEEGYREVDVQPRPDAE